MANKLPQTKQSHNDLVVPSETTHGTATSTADIESNGQSPPKHKIDASEKIDIRKLKIRYDFWKWFCGTLIIGLFTAISTQIIKSHEAKIHDREVENNYLSPMLKQYMVYDGDKLKYNRTADLAKFMSLTVDDDDYRKRWLALFNYCDSMYRKKDTINQTASVTLDSLYNTKITIQKLLDQVKNKKQDDPQTRSLNQRLNEVNTQIQATTSLKADIAKNIDTPKINTPPVIKNLVQLPQKSEYVAAPKEQFSLIDSATKYISKNYGQTWAGNFDITVNSVSSHDQTANVSYYTVDHDTYTMFQDNVDLNSNQEVVVFSPDLSFKYVVKLVDFGKLGLKSTAYFSVRAYKRN